VPFFVAHPLNLNGEEGEILRTPGLLDVDASGILGPEVVATLIDLKEFRMNLYRGISREFQKNFREYCR
jgi:hypothetical protein